MEAYALQPVFRVEEHSAKSKAQSEKHRFRVQGLKTGQDKKRYKARPSEIRSAVVNEFHPDGINGKKRFHWARGVKVVGGEVAEDLFTRGLYLPSGTAMTEEHLDRVISAILICKR